MGKETPRQSLPAESPLAQERNGEGIAVVNSMRYSNVFFGLIGIGAGLMLAPKVGEWNKYLTRRISCGIKRTESAVSDVADGIIDKLEKGRKAVTA
jgi:hypothetical protein